MEAGKQRQVITFLAEVFQRHEFMTKVDCEKKTFGATNEQLIISCFPVLNKRHSKILGLINAHVWSQKPISGR